MEEEYISVKEAAEKTRLGFSSFYSFLRCSKFCRNNDIKVYRVKKKNSKRVYKNKTVFENVIKKEDFEKIKIELFRKAQQKFLNLFHLSIKKDKD